MKTTLILCTLALTFNILNSHAREFGGSGIGGGYSSTKFSKLSEVRFYLQDRLADSRPMTIGSSISDAVKALESGLIEAEKKLVTDHQTKNSFTAQLLKNQIDYLSIIGLKGILESQSDQHLYDVKLILTSQYQMNNFFLETFDKSFYLPAMNIGQSKLSKQNQRLLEKTTAYNLYQVIYFNESFVHEIMNRSYVSEDQKRKYLSGFIFWIHQYKNMLDENNTHRVKLEQLAQKIQNEMDSNHHYEYMNDFFHIMIDIVDANPENSQNFQDLLISI